MSILPTNPTQTRTIERMKGKIRKLEGIIELLKHELAVSQDQKFTLAQALFHDLEDSSALALAKQITQSRHEEVQTYTQDPAEAFQDQTDV